MKRHDDESYSIFVKYINFGFLLSNLMAVIERVTWSNG